MERNMNSKTAEQLVMRLTGEATLKQTPKVEGVLYYGLDEPYHGALCLTGHHVILYADDSSRKELWILHKNVDNVEKRLGQDSGLIQLSCKDFTLYQFQVPDLEAVNNICSSIETLSSVMDPNFLYPMFYRPDFNMDKVGWDLYSMDFEFASVCSKSDDWVVSDINSNYAVCTTYPEKIIVPKSVNEAVLRKSAAFRQGGRLPVLAYCHANGTALVRCGQPLSGPSNKRSKEDEKLLNAFLGSAGRGYILDLRSSQTAMQAKTRGGGVETEVHYPRWKRVHHSLHGYYSLQESLTRLTEATHDGSATMDRWLGKLEATNWLHHVKESLAVACLAAQCLDRKQWSVLIHGTEGMDCTLIVTSLTQLILDQGCRTVVGFFNLIEREWLRAGHPFMLRGSHAGFSMYRQKEEGPVFALFLDCAYQLLVQFPMSFEFNAAMLKELRSHAYASKFGTFLCNNENERSIYKLRTKTTSLWSYLQQHDVLTKFVNPLYKRRDSVIWPSVAPQSIELWEELYVPWLHTDTILWSRILKLKGERDELLARNSRLSDKVKEYELTLGKIVPVVNENIEISPGTFSSVPNNLESGIKENANTESSDVNLIDFMGTENDMDSLEAPLSPSLTNAVSVNVNSQLNGSENIFASVSFKKS